ncbi:S24 family peptidase [Wielerella bovis]|uniref:S24 family peptidase n=1 Tax=Wielerella bovis TaxID=2917790 RepID=UPI0020189051|nr:S24 family peptidase [Wielerella bovis]ULJ68912.1 S24 family peptidase [Wielerella bovis]
MELGAQEITELVEKAAELGAEIDLPSTKTGVKKRADSQNWATRVVKGKGGRGGLKTLYSLPLETIEELKEKGLLHLLDKGDAEPVAPRRKQPALRPVAVGVPDSMRSMVAEYDDWAAEQDTGAIVPVRYHVNVFGSAGNGYIFNESLETQAMWFRASFFNVLGVKPEKCFCTRVKGSSMEPTLIDRGTVLWQMQDRYATEGIYLFRQVEELRIKRLQRVNGYTFRIISDNPNKDIYPTELLDLRELEDYEFEIYGKYLWDCAIRP